MVDRNKKIKLHQFLDDYAKEDVALAFSGGVDSGLLLHMLCEKAKKYGSTVYAVTIHTTMHPICELEEAARAAEEAGAVHATIAVDELRDAGIENNPVDRCYRCKYYLYSRLVQFAKEKQVKCMIEGTNYDDLHVYRPGRQAVAELGIKSPLASAGLTKEEVRALAAEYKIASADKPSTPCLATRFPYGTTLDYEAMRKVEKAESYLRRKGFYNVRVRVHGEIARIEVDENAIEKFLTMRKETVRYFKELGYVYPTIDLEGFRSGSMDVGIL